jgi:predicted RNA-binding protein YlqC (UPF0109 family)
MRQAYHELAEYLVKGLVDYPEQVNLETSEERGQVIIQIRVAEGDAGRVIGKQGRVINAIRALLEAHADSRGERISLDIV